MPLIPAKKEQKTQALPILVKNKTKSKKIESLSQPVLVELKTEKKRGRPKKVEIKEQDREKLVVVLSKADLSEIEKPFNLLKKRSTRVLLKENNDRVNQSTHS